ncbi:GNAT family N-acetyltransferase [Cytobacillus spongiae]|jgi:ribosomal-protein-serine acetyltransferase|uniref:GNAT family N-acetyltransferase n=1 Tax=Cytobacillus spongiae TaxID=2901381 RepID=UPI001F47374A|nr:GNAT family protein [Cytobacillus spongiae]UII54302.1 GNAT family N-acetyltransferase [Cytobacillus spongiae]
MFIHKIDENVSLKLIELNDAERVFELTDGSRAYLKEWLPWLDFTKSVEDTKNYIHGCLKEMGENKCLHSVILFNGEIVGIASFNTINWSNQTAYIGYWLGESYQGNGIVTKVAKALTSYAFEHLSLNKVEIRAAVENKKSRSVPERLGYIKEGSIRQAEWLYDHYVDHVVYGVLASEWRDRLS